MTNGGIRRENKKSGHLGSNPSSGTVTLPHLPRWGDGEEDCENELCLKRALRSLAEKH